MAPFSTAHRSAARVVFVLALSATETLFSALSDAHPLTMYGLSSRSMAMASAMTADVSDGSANYYNPAGLVRSTGVRVELSYLYVQPQLRANGLDTQVDSIHGLSAGIVAPGKIFSIPFSIGIGLYIPDDRLSRLRSLAQTQPRWELYENRAQLLYFAANLAVSPVPWLRLGAGIGYVSSTRGGVRIYGDINALSPSQSDLAHEVDADLSTVRYPLAGAQIDLLPGKLTIGASYRGEYAIKLDIDAVIEGEIVAGRNTDPNALRIPGQYTLRSISTAVFQPHQVAVGASFKPLPDLTIVGDLTWTNWSAYPNPAAHLTVGLVAEIPAGVGLTLPPLPPAQRILPASFNDTFAPRLGAEWLLHIAAHQLALRLGYRYEPTPVPDQVGRTNFLDSNRHVLSLGLGFLLRQLAPVLPGGLGLDLHADIQVLEQRTVLKDDPADPVGDLVLDGLVLGAGATVSASF